MKRIFSCIAFGICGLMVGLSTAGNGVVAQFTSPPDSHGVMYLANHHREFSFQLVPGQSQSLLLPKENCSVRVEIAITHIIEDVGQTTQVHPPDFLSTTVVYDPIAGKAYHGPGAESVSLGGGLTIDRVVDINTGTVTVRTLPMAGNTIHQPINFCVEMWY